MIEVRSIESVSEWPPLRFEIRRVDINFTTRVAFEKFTSPLSPFPFPLKQGKSGPLNQSNQGDIAKERRARGDGPLKVDWLSPPPAMIWSGRASGPVTLRSARSCSAHRFSERRMQCWARSSF